MNREATSQQQLNLAALQRLDNRIIDVLGTSTHVAVYKFDVATQAWNRRDVEGSLFIVKRMDEPFEKLIVMNRLSTKNLVEDVDEKMLIKCQGPYLIYKIEGNINGIWFYESSDQEKIFQQLKDIQKQKQLQSSMGIPPPSPSVSQLLQPPSAQLIQQQQQMNTSGGMHLLPPQQLINMYQQQQQQQMPPQQPIPQTIPQPQQPQQHQPQPNLPPGLMVPNMINNLNNQQQQQAPNSPTQTDTIPILAKLMSSVKIKQPEQAPIPAAANTSSTDLLNTLISSSSSSISSSTSQPNNIKLSKDQFKDILRKLVNDDQFVSQVYNAYTIATEKR